ncbi:flagellar FlbD family protein [Clostridium thermarum]|uniref:flagellar FlbD family protein n=1 Tax=Clostridium thermarum TaxID=1716543 RepID=UPI0013CFAEEF|nr:flagellar FlbD family protein [Clostridium thermarum]
MIKLVGFNGKDFVLNADHIEKIEEVPECLITLTNGKKYMVMGNSQEVIDKVIEYKKRIFSLKL